MHAKSILQDFLSKKCRTMHAKRRACLTKMVEAARVGGLTLVRMSHALPKTTSLKHRIKCCDRLLGNPRLHAEKTAIYGALSHAILGNRRVGIIIDWSDLLADGSAHLLRAAVIVKGRAFTVYEEVHSQDDYGSLRVHRRFLETLRTVLPAGCQPVLVTDAGFRATWFHLAEELNYEWVGRIRNRDMVRAQGADQWDGCKTLYPQATGRPRNLGEFEYVRSNPISCRLVAFKKAPQKRHRRTAFGSNARSTSSMKNRAAQIEPWLLAVSPGLAALSAKAIVAIYAGRMQIEQTFRDSKNANRGMGLSMTQSCDLDRLAVMLLLGALLSFSLWLIGLAAVQAGYTIGYGSKKNALTTFSILSLARHWCCEQKKPPTAKQLKNALVELTLLVRQI